VLESKNQEPRCQEPNNKYRKKYKKEQNKFQAKNPKALRIFGKPLDFLLLWSLVYFY